MLRLQISLMPFGAQTVLRYRRCSDADHIRRDVGIFNEVAKLHAEQKKIIDQIVSLKEQVR